MPLVMASMIWRCLRPVIMELPWVMREELKEKPPLFQLKILRMALLMA